MKYLLIPILTLVLLTTLSAQRGPSSGRTSRTGGRVPPGPSGPDVVVNFHGTLASFTTKKLTLSPSDSEKPGKEEQNQIDFLISRKTTVYDGDKKLKPAGLKPGQPLEVEARRLLDGTLEAVTIRVEQPERTR